MIHYRPFLNSDPPLIAEIWRSQPPSTAFMQPMTPAVLDDTVFAKPFFDRHGLILALDGDKPVGFVHGGFGCPVADSSSDQTSLDHSRGTTAMLLVTPRDDRIEIARELLARSEAYLKERGATSLFVGSTQDLAPFYLGLYSGSQLSGAVALETEIQQFFGNQGYSTSPYAKVMRRDLASFRPPVDRDLMQVRRQYQLVKQTETLATTWWEAAQFATIERVEFVLLPKGKGSPVGLAKFWDVQPLATAWGVHAAGLLSIEVNEQPRATASALATHFMSESLKQMQSFGATLAEFHVRADDSLLADVCAKLAFEESDQGILFRKTIS